MAAAAKPAQRSGYELPSDEVERLLRSGEQPELLKTYFGEARYQELRELARQTATRAAVRGGPRVFIVPGILGSMLGLRRLLLSHIVWYNPVSLIAGEATKLTFNGAGKIEALDIVPYYYTMLKFRLWWFGFDADYYWYDWRQSLDALGKELARRIAQEPGDVHLVVHSMGGLVARAALAAGADKVKKLVMLGTPNYGSFAPVQVLRGVNEMIKHVDALDLRHTAEELTRSVFSSFPSVYQMLPTREKFNQIDLYDADAWPAAGPKPRPPLLAAAPAVQAKFAAPDERFFLVAGVNRWTVTQLARDDDGEFLYVLSAEGDGTVPLDYAKLPNVPTYHVEEEHSALANNLAVAETVRDLLNTGRSERLPDAWTPPTRAAVAAAAEVADRQVRAREPFGGRRGHAVTEGDRRQVLETMLSPVPVASPEQALAAPRTPPAVAAVPTPGMAPMHGVVVGRRRQHRLDIVLVPGSITNVNARTYVVGTFANVTPDGAARAIDALLDGAVSEFVSRRMFGAGVGEVFMLPTGRHPLRADIVLFAGLGSFDQFTDEVQQLVAQNVIRTLIRAGMDEFATVLFGGGSGREAAVTLENLVRGFFAGLRDADVGHRFRRVILCELDPARYAQMRDQLYRLVATDLFDEVEVTIDEEAPQAPMAAAQPRAGALPSAAEQPAYLIVRQESDGARPGFRSAVLTAGGKATVVTAFQACADDALTALLGKLGKASTDLDRVGADLAALVLAPEVIDLLGREEMNGRHLVVVHDRPASRIPWETLKVSKAFPATLAGLSRRYLADNFAIAKWLEERRLGPTLSILLVIDPTENLAGAEREGKVLHDLVRQMPAIRLTERRGAEATRAALLKDFQSGQFDAIHYAGHAFFDEKVPGRSGILCAGEQVLGGQDLVSLGNLPALVFFNACESARVRKARPAKKEKEKKPEVGDRLRDSVGLAEAFLRGGVANFVGTYWPVEDDAAATFAKVFYGEVIAGKPVGDALLAGRTEVRKLPSNDWADYLLYGNHEFVLKQRGA